MAEDDGAQFEEVAHSGGRITLIPQDNGGIDLRVEHDNPWACSMYQVCVSLDGHLLDVVPITGIGPMPPYPTPSIIAYVISDREGLFGRHCKRCDSYFRTDCADRVQVCPYCAVRQLNVHFTTENQGKFIEAYCREFIRVHETPVGSRTELQIDLDKVTDQLPDNRPSWHYSEERQQTRNTCEYCQTVFDILGEYGSCPNCGVRNWSSTFVKQVRSMRQDFVKARESISTQQREERQRNWRRLVVECVSTFEALGNDMRTLILRAPATPRRKGQMRNLSFQQVESVLFQLALSTVDRPTL